ncbi:MAG TPA: metalloregulator ArsR/SmtB family transcription factor [Candidatus Methylomirabilis sp.]|nr:metalloregulator ArsR/SmtB family transcription factor [Candidatus Methylomirabilis sp.]
MSVTSLMRRSIREPLDESRSIDRIRHVAIVTSDLTKARRWFGALSDETRLRLIALLGNGEQCVCDLTDALQAAQSRLSFHLKVLKDAGLVTDRRDGRWVYYSLEPGALEELAEFVSDLKVKRTSLRLAPRRCD